MKKKILITVIVLFNTFTACKYSHKIQNADKNMISIPTEYIETTIDTDLQTSQRKTEIVTTSSNYPEDEVIKAYEEIATESRLYFGDMFYDLDFDGVLEYIKANGGEHYGESFNTIYKYVDGSVIKIGDYLVGGQNEEWSLVPKLTLYYDSKLNKYFYIAEDGFRDKLAYDNYAQICRYEFIDSQWIKTLIAKCEFDFCPASATYINITKNTFLGKDNTPIGMQKISDMSCYYNGVKEYLNQFTKIEEIEMGNVLISPYDDTYDNLYYNYYIKSHEDNN